MADNSITHAPPEPAPKGSSEKKSTTRLISIHPVENPLGAAPMPKTIQLKRPATATLNMADAPSRAKGDTARIGQPAATARHPAPAADAPREGIHQQRPPADRKSTTMRISLDDILPAATQPQDGKQVTMPIKLADMEPQFPPTIKQKRPPTSLITMALEPAPAKSKTSPLDAPTTARALADNAKKGTTHLILDDISDPAPAGEPKRSTSAITVIPQTIRLKRAGDSPMAPPTQAKVHTDAIGGAPTISRMPNLAMAKMTTARIIVEETETALPPPTEVKRATVPIPPVSAPLDTAPTPRTIRLKKPSSVGLEEAVAAGMAGETPTVQKIKKTETAKIDVSQDTTAGPITQRKTIKIKRTERNVAPRTVRMKQPGTAIALAGTPAGPREAGEEEQAMPEEDRLAPLFIGVAAAAAILVTGLVYIMASQAFGPELVLPIPASIL